MSDGLSADDVVMLLEKEWKNIQKQLGPDWDNFARAYCTVVDQLPEKPGIEDIEITIDRICELLYKYKYTRKLLKKSHGESAEKLLISPGKILNESEELNQICNTMRSLSQKSINSKNAKKGKYIR